ncbi:MFS transporter [Fusobacterium sp. PH5-44]|uniref:MFS transporter n=1 Tax=unclassified Fusobacterium TaxID=2648384 RepID=UPI003D1D4184
MTTNPDKNNINIIFRIILLTAAGAFIYAVHSGIRNNYGIMINSIVDNAGLSFSAVSFVLAIGQLMFGLVQPIFGIIVVKKGNKYPFILGATLVIMGLLLTSLCKSIFSLMICLGIILPAGSGAISYGIIIGTISPKISAKYISTVSGIVNASSGIGNTLMSPIINYLISSGGLRHGMFSLTIPIAISLPVSFLMNRKNQLTLSNSNQKQNTPINIKDLLKKAFKNQGYIFLLIGFFTCGFHMAIITNHLPTEIRSFGHSSESSAYAFSIYGITTIIGSVLSGTLCNRFKMKNVLGFFYAMRPITILLFLIFPKTILNMTIFTALFGFSGAATVPPVSGVIGKFFGASSVATLFGLVFFCHQIGGFFGAWFGGVCFDLTNSYFIIWSVSLVFSIIAAGVSFAIKEDL